MKKFIKNHLAVILSFAIILTTILPVIGGVFVSANEAEIAAAVETLKTEWVKLGQSVESPLYVGRYYVNNANQGNIGKTPSTYTGTLPEYVDLGLNYGEITLTDAAIDVAGRSQQVFLEANSANTTGNIEDIYFWVKPTFAGSENISFNVTVTYSEQNTYANPVVIPATKDGQWIKISLDEVQGGDWKAALGSAASRAVARLELTFTGNSGDKVLISASHEVIARTLPAGSENWSADEWVTNAKAVTGIAYDDTAFKAAIVALEAALANQSPEAIALEGLKSAWKSLGTQVDGLGIGRYFGAAGTNTGNIGNVSNTFTETLPAGVDLGRYFGRITLEGAGEMNANKQLVLFEQNGSTNTIADIEDLRFWVKPTFAGSSDITITAGVVIASRNVLSGSFTIPASKNGQWVEVSFDAMNNGDWKSTFGASSANKPGRLDVVFSGNNGDQLLLGSALEVVTSGRDLPAESSSWSNAEWVANAKAVDLTNATNVQQFKDAIANLESILGENLQQGIALAEFKEAWKNLGSKVHGLSIGRYFGAAGTSIGAINRTPDTFTETLPAGVDLGRSWGVITLEGAGDMNTNKQLVLYEYGGATNTVGAIEDIRFWVKPTFAGTTDITIKASVNFSGRNVLAQEFVIPASKNGQWVEVSFDAMNNGDWKSALGSAAANKPTRLDICFSGSNGDTLILGSSLEVVSERELPAGSNDWTVDDWIVAGSELDLRGALNVDEFNVALAELSKFASGSPAEIKAIAEFKNAWADLGETVVSTLVPNRYFVNDASTGAQKNASSYTGELPEEVKLGSLYGEIALEGQGSIISPRNQQLFLEGNSTNTVGDMEDIAFWVKPTFAGTGNISFNVTVTFSNQNTYATPVTITPDKNNEWILISLNDVAGGSWKTNFASASAAKPQRIELTFSGNSGDKVIVGSALEVIGKKALPANTQGWNADQWIEAAEALNLNGCVNIAEFKEAITKLYSFASVSREEKTAIKQLKNGWAQMNSISNSTLVVKRCYDNGELKDVSKSPVAFPEALPDGVSLGNRYGEITLTGAATFDDNHQNLFIEGNSTYKTGELEDIFFYIRPEFAGDEDITLDIAVTYSQRNKYANPVVITPEQDGEWIRISLDEVQGGDWKAALASASSRSVLRVEVCFSGSEGDKITVGSAFEVTTSAKEIPSDTDAWNIADWLHASAYIDPDKYLNTEAYVEARAYAEDVRDRLLIARSCEVQDFATMEDAENGIDDSLIKDTNMLEGVKADISVYDGTTSTPLTENDTVANLTDADMLSSFNMDGLAGNSDTFVDFVFDVEGLATVNQMLIVNDGTLLADKYYIYVGDSRSELFLGKNLVAAHTLVENNAVQFINFTNNAIPEGKFIGVRFYTDNTTLTIPEIAAYGPVTIYSVEKGNYDDVMVAALGKNLLKGIEPRFKTSSSQKQNWTMFKNQFSVQSKIESLTDGDMSTGVGYYQQNPETVDDRCTLHFFYDLGDTYTIQQVHLQHINLAGYQTGEYEVYASPDLASLFSAKNKIISYDNRVNGPNGTSVTQVFTLNKQINARYVSFCIKFPVSDFERLSAGVNQGLGIRLMELGVYGPRYEKPYALVNLGAGAALDVTKVDASGKSEKINDKDYDGTEHKFTYDGLANTYASVDLADDEKIEFFYDLAADQVINKLQIKTNAGTIKQMKIYASDKLEEMYKSSSMVLNYNALVEDMGNEVFVDFTESPRKMRYVRFVIEDIEGNIFEPSEIEIIGGNDQEFFYNNLAEGKSDTASFFASSAKGTMAISEHANKWKFGHTTWSVMYHSGNALDNDPDTVFDFYGGKNGEESINMLIDMGTLNSIDNIKILGGSSEQYWPEEINFYFSTNDLDLYSEKAVPAKKWTSKPADGVFSFDFVPQIAQYVRVEIVRSDDTIYSLEKYGNKIATVLAEIQVNGLEARGRVVNGVVASFVDEETGIAVDINALRDNDVYTTVQDILVKKRAANADEKASVKNENNMQLVSEVYEVYLLDLNGNIVTDFDGRTVTFRIPQSLAEQTDDVYLLNGGWGGFNMVEFETVNGYYCAVFDDATFSTFALGAYAEFDEEIEEEEEPEEVIPDEEEEEEEIIEEEPEDDDEDDDKPKRKKKIKVIRKNNNENGYLWIIIVAVGAFAIAAGVVLFIILKKKKNKEEEEE